MLELIENDAEYCNDGEEENLINGMTDMDVKDNGYKITNRSKKAVKMFGNILMILSCLFIGSKLAAYGRQIKWEDIIANKWWIVLEIIVYAAIVMTTPFAYNILIKIATGTSIPFQKVQYIYCKSNLYKYIPGNIFQFIGRNQIASMYHLKHAEVAFATIMELGIIVVSSMIVAVVFGMDSAGIWIQEHTDVMFIVGLACAAVCFGIAAVMILWKKAGAVLAKIRHLFHIKNMIGISAAVIWFCSLLVFNGVLFFFCFKIAGQEMFINDLHTIVGLYALAFCIGFITPGAPGGIGIREAVLLFFIGQTIGEAQMAAVTILFRIISVMGDVAAYLAAEVWNVRNRGKRQLK